MFSFQTQEELQKFLLPVLKIRVNSLKEEGIIKTETELFNFLKENKWKSAKDLYLHEIVEDILHYKIEQNIGGVHETI